jgi:uncharacterized protein YwgA
MSRMQRAALLAELVDLLHENASWAGETHIQKSVFLLEELFDQPLSYDFILYKHGPYSFALKDELSAARADQIMTLDPRPPYGPKYVTTEASKELRARFPKTLMKARPFLELIATFLGSKSVIDLEQFSTAMYVYKEDEARPLAEMVQRLQVLKPHISEYAAIQAFELLDELRQKAKEMTEAGV